jgi:hypothetical protein
VRPPLEHPLHKFLVDVFCDSLQTALCGEPVKSANTRELNILDHVDGRLEKLATTAPLIACRLLHATRLVVLASVIPLFDKRIYGYHIIRNLVMRVNNDSVAAQTVEGKLGRC